jgi:radical SAM protein with 4Fe4S-binding SPASM domain
MKTEMVNSLYKMVNKFYNLTNKMKYGEDMFFRMEIETTSTCNRKCHYCPNSIHNRGNHLMPLELYEKIMKELKDLKWSGMIHPHFYGEPLLDDRLPFIVKKTREYLPKSKIIIYTNGDLLTKEKYDAISPFVDGFYVTNHGNLNPNIPKERKIVVRSITNFVNRGGLIVVPEDKKCPKVSKCMMATQNVTITWNGDVVLCSEDFFSKHCFGNLEKERLIDVWNKPEFIKIRKELRNGVFNSDMCKKCIGK